MTELVPNWVRLAPNVTNLIKDVRFWPKAGEMGLKLEKLAISSDEIVLKSNLKSPEFVPFKA